MSRWIEIWSPPNGLSTSPGDAGDEEHVVAVGVDVEAGEVERARVEAAAGRIDVGAGAVVVAGRVGEPADARAVGDDGDLLHGGAAARGPRRRR